MNTNQIKGACECIWVLIFAGSEPDRYPHTLRIDTNTYSKIRVLITCQLSLFSNATTDISLHALVSPHHP